MKRMRKAGLLLAFFFCLGCHDRAKPAPGDGLTLPEGTTGAGSDGGSINLPAPDVFTAVKDITVTNSENRVVRKWTFDYSGGDLSRAAEEVFNPAGEVSDGITWTFMNDAAADEPVPWNAVVETLIGDTADYAFTLDDRGRIRTMQTSVERVFEGSNTAITFEYAEGLDRPDNANAKFLNETGEAVGEINSRYEYDDRGFLSGFQQINALPENDQRFEQDITFDANGFVERSILLRVGIPVRREEYSNLLSPEGRLVQQSQIAGGDRVITLSYDAAGRIQGYCLEREPFSGEKCHAYTYVNLEKRPDLYQLLPHPHRQFVEGWPAEFLTGFYPMASW